MTALAVVLAGVAAAVWARGRPSLLQGRLGASVWALAARNAGSRAVLRHARNSRHWLSAAGAVAGMVVAWAIGGPGIAVLAGAGATAFIVGPRRAARVRNLSQQEAAVAEACVVLSAELRAGEPPRQALTVVAADWPELFGPAAGQSAVGGDVAQALRQCAGVTGVHALAAVAAAWEVSERTGTALSGLLTALADGLRADAVIRREADSQLSTMRVTARLLAVLPVATLLLFSGGSVAPVRFLLYSPYGVGCLGAAAVLAGLGLWWVDRLARVAVRPPP